MDQVVDTDHKTILARYFSLFTDLLPEHKRNKSRRGFKERELKGVRKEKINFFFLPPCACPCALVRSTIKKKIGVDRLKDSLNVLLVSVVKSTCTLVSQDLTNLLLTNLLSLLCCISSDIEYSYHVRRIPYADYRVNEVIPVFNSKDFTNSSHVTHQENRLFRKRYGIKIEFHQSGRLGE